MADSVGRGRPRIEDRPEEMRCKAKSKQTGERCCQFVSAGMKVCHYHGGATPSGLNASRFKTGRYSRWLPKRLMDRYQEALNDEKALAQREEIALMESRAKDLLQRVDSGESGALMKELRKHVAEYEKASRSRREDKYDTMSDVLAELFSAIKRAQADYKIWDEIAKVVNQTTRLRESERRYMVEQHEMYSAEEVRIMMVAVGDVIKREVKDQIAVQAVAREIAKLENIAVRGPSEQPSAN